MIEFFKTLWVSGWANRAMLIAGGLIFTGAVVGLLYALLRKKKDSAFMKTNSGAPIKWDPEAFPITALFDPFFPEHYMMAYRQIALEINQFIGEEVLDIFGMAWELTNEIDKATDVPYGHLYLKLADDIHGGENLYRYSEHGEMLGCFIRISAGLEGELLLTVMEHELGHALGLAHDDEIRASVMYPTTYGRAKDFTDKDKQRLRVAYGGKDVSKSTDRGRPPPG